MVLMFNLFDLLLDLLSLVVSFLEGVSSTNKTTYNSLLIWYRALALIGCWPQPLVTYKLNSLRNLRSALLYFLGLRFFLRL